VDNVVFVFCFSDFCFSFGNQVAHKGRLIVFFSSAAAAVDNQHFFFCSSAGLQGAIQMSVIWIVHKGRLIDVIFSHCATWVNCCSCFLSRWLIVEFCFPNAKVYSWFSVFCHPCFVALLCCMGWLPFLFDCLSRLHLCWLLFSFLFGTGWLLFFVFVLLQPRWSPLHQ